MKIAIVGAGIAGLTAAHDLMKKGHQVTIFEAADHVGGLAAGFKESHWDWSVERFYHHWFQSDSAMLGLIDELGWSDQLVFPRPVTVMYHQGKFYPFDSIPSALLYPGLGWGINKVRFGLVNLAIRFTNNWRSLEKFTVDQWMRKYAGDKAYEAVWEPMVIGKFGERYARQVNMAWMWARLKARTPRLGTFKGGFQAFSDQFAAYLKNKGVQILLNTPVKSIRKDGESGLLITTAAGEQIFEQSLVTSSPSLMARMAPELPKEYLEGLLNLKSLGAVVLTLSIKQQLSKEGYYWFNLPKKAGFPFLALVEHTNYLSPDYFGGDHILYCGDYLETDHEYFQLTQEEIIQRFTPSLQRINPDFQPDWIKNAWLYRTQYAQPVPFINHSKNIPDIRTPLPGLFFASMSQVYPWDRGTNFAVEIAHRASAMMG
ncbi:MAG: NAD(P)/FAD-dependent oxidoreductase [Anaerolineaceae bacterium]|jgi:protoporphyrinogen oxidase|nr:NAD(P)/FAD-dependent oxidoreductase [Anaerolineaceae bacterium]